MKRVLSILLAAAMTLSLAACGSSGAGAPSGSAPSAPKVAYTDLLQMAGEEVLQAGTLTEEAGYSSLLIEGIDWETAMTYRDELFVPLNNSGHKFYHNDYGALDCGTQGATNESVYSEELKRGAVVYVHAIQYDDTLLFLAGDELPDEREQWAMAGVPEEYLPAPKIPVFDGDSVARFIPVCDSIDLSARDYNGRPEEDLYITFYLSDLTREQMDEYVQAALDMGYEEHSRGDIGIPSYDSFCFEGELPNKVSIHLYYCDGTLMTSVLGPAYTPGDPWGDLLTYMGYGDGIPDYEPSFNELLMGGLWVDICWDELMALYSGDALGKGTGTDTSGFVYWDMVDATTQTFRSCVSDAQSNGFTQGAEYGDNRYTAYKNIDYEGNEVTLWVTACLQGDYFFCAVGLGKVDADRYPEP